MSTSPSTRSSTSSSAYSTRDLHLASWLVALGHTLTIEGPQHQRTFVFSDVPAGAVESYFAAPCSLSAAALFSAYATLRKRLFAVA